MSSIALKITIYIIKITHIQFFKLSRDAPTKVYVYNLMMFVLPQMIILGRRLGAEVHFTSYTL